MSKHPIQLSDHFTYPRLLKFVAPSILMMIFTSIYYVVDGFFVSNYVGKTPFAALNFIMPFIMILGGMGFIVGTGGSALVAKELGRGQKERANRIFSLLIAFVIITALRCPFWASSSSAPSRSSWAQAKQCSRTACSTDVSSSPLRPPTCCKTYSKAF